MIVDNQSGWPLVWFGRGRAQSSVLVSCACGDDHLQHSASLPSLGRAPTISKNLQSFARCDSPVKLLGKEVVPPDVLLHRIRQENYFV